ncbi:MAG: peroxidase, partial [Microcoleus sp. SIO2G3]|nr:peroxidase [Microcoleus sp. SIO2G3]
STQPYLYQLASGFAPQELFAIGNTNVNPGAGDGTIKTELPNDLPRVASGLAIIGDPRNDENLIVAQLHLAFLKFHNKVVAGLKDGSIERRSPIRKSLFEEARDIVTWHYQWIVVHDFLRRILDNKQLESVLEEGRKFYHFEKDPFIPVEFSVAAYRLGHSMVRSVYDYNRVFTPLPGGVTPATLELLFSFTGKSGSADDPFPVPIPSDWIIDWRRFFEIDKEVEATPSRKLDPFLVEPLKNLPNVPPPSSLAVRNLLRGRSLGLPTGQSVARRMRLRPLTPDQIARGKDGKVAKKHGFDRETPLWYYILKEAQVQAQGLHLGQVGSRIVAEVFVGLLEGDSDSFLSRSPEWTPTLPAAVPGTFTLADMLKFVGDLSPIDDPANRS